jgi:hypothetical protein
MEHEEELLKLKLEENKLDLDELNAHLADTASARNREVAVNESANAHILQKLQPQF